MLKLLKNLKKKEWYYILISTIFIVAIVYLDLKLPSFMSEITTLLYTGGSVGEILIQGLWMLLCALGSGMLGVTVGLFVAKVAGGLSATLRSKIYNKIQGYSATEMKKFSIASLITRTTNDVTQVQNVVAMGLQVIIKAPILAVWAIVIILGKSWQWSVITAIAVALLIIVISTLIIFVMPKFKKMQVLTDNLNRVTRENLTGVRVVKAYNAENFEENKFEKANQQLTKNNLFTNRMLAILFPFMSLLMSGLSLAIYWVGAYIINQAGIMEKLSLFSDMVVFVSYAMQVILAFMLLIMVFIMFPRAIVSAKRINEVLATNPTIFDGDSDFEKTNIQGKIEFKNVSFKYNEANKYVLKNINFVAKKGETIAFIGSTGSGKSTLVNLMPRFYDATEGEILINGVDIKKYKLSDLNNKIGYIPQKAFLFSGTVESNIAYGENNKGQINFDTIKNAIKIAQGKEFVEKMENQYQAEIAKNGTNLSGGQKQRLSIARAIAREPEILIFDDSFSALDYKTDKKLREALKKEIKNTTKIIVAQRIGTIKDADKIVVLDKGEIVSIGTHQELLKNCTIYKEIALSQLSKEEL
ncbi:MAG: ABC transporter ATP-binding protein [Clostridia bacterium]|nr:ABC transporter ATP-binding protein [Clostridia bacterium]